jgi:hypothetical protein
VKLSEADAADLADWLSEAVLTLAPVELHVLAQRWELRCAGVPPFAFPVVVQGEKHPPTEETR